MPTEKYLLSISPERVYGIEEDNPFNYVLCPICNKKFEIITLSHVSKCHKMSMSKFKELYPNQELQSEKYKKEFREKRSKNSKMFFEKLRKDPDKYDKYIKNWYTGNKKNKSSIIHDIKEKTDVDKINVKAEKMENSFRNRRIHGIEDDDPFNYVTCPICNRKFDIITGSHIFTYHKINMTRFKKLYPDQQLRSNKYKKEFSKKRSESTKKYLNSLKNDQEKWNNYFKNFRYGNGKKKKEKIKSVEINNIQGNYRVIDGEFIGKNIDIDDPTSYVICPLCNRKFSIISDSHLEKIHNITREEFENMYPNNSLRSEKHIEKMKESRKKYWGNLSFSEYSERVKQSAINISNKHLYNYVLSNGQICNFKAKWEIYVAEFFIENNIEFIYEKEFMYYENDKKRCYLADFVLPKYNLVIELKSRFLIENNRENIKLKNESVLALGYNFVIITYNRKNKVLKDIKRVLMAYQSTLVTK